jgi:hypothetical protein
MKKTFRFALFVLVLLAACTPASSRPSAATPSALPAPQTVGECVVTPHEVARQGLPIPIAIAANVPGVDGVSLFWKDGSPLGAWPTGQPSVSTQVHVAGVIPDGIEVTPLVFLGGDEDGATSLKASLGGQVSTLMTFPPGVTVTGLTGVPGRTWVVYSTLEPSPDGSSLRSSIYLGEYASIASAAPALSVDSSQSRYVRPVAVHRDVNGAPEGIWFTYRLWGIGGDAMTEAQNGLYYFDLAGGGTLEFLGMGCPFSALSNGQNLAVWITPGQVHVTDVHSGATSTHPLLPGNDRAAHASFSPSEGYVSWLEGKGWEYDGTLATTLRVTTPDGAFAAEYPFSAFAEASGLGADIAIVPLGWLAPDNENILVAVYSVSTGRSGLVYVDVNGQRVTPLIADGVFAGFAYP